MPEKQDFVMDANRCEGEDMAVCPYRGDDPETATAFRCHFDFGRLRGTETMTAGKRAARCPWKKAVRWTAEELT